MALNFPLRAATVVAFAITALAAPEHSSDPCNGNTAPIQIRLAYAGDNGMAVSWNTKQQLKTPTVYYSRSPRVNSFSQSAQSHISTTYQSSSTWNNHVVITGLEPDATYYYLPQCGNETYSFRTARAPGLGPEFSFAMIGDMGTFGPDGLSTTVGKGASNPLQPGEHTTIQSLWSLKDRYEFIWHG